jgi:hypothetical protein
MPVPALILPLLVAAAQPAEPVVVTGHAWAPFISPMGEPFRARTPADDTLANWFLQADRDHDGALTLDEMLADADRFFAILDINHDHEIEPEELVHYEWEVAPEIQVNSRTRRKPGEAKQSSSRSGDDELAIPDRRRRGRDGGLQGAARYALLNIPEPVAAADTDFDRGISPAEFRQAATARFNLLDSDRQGKILLKQLQALRSAIQAAGPRPRRGGDQVDMRVGNPLPPGD